MMVKKYFYVLPSAFTEQQMQKILLQKCCLFNVIYNTYYPFLDNTYLSNMYIVLFFIVYPWKLLKYSYQTINDCVILQPSCVEQTNDVECTRWPGSNQNWIPAREGVACRIGKTHQFITILSTSIPPDDFSCIIKYTETPI